MFGGAQRESQSLDEEFKLRYSLASSANVWMNKELTLQWCDEVVSWDENLTKLRKSQKKKSKENLSMQKLKIVPGGCTRYIKAPGLV